jgi:hypothetical protein
VRIGEDQVADDTARHGLQLGTAWQHLMQNSNEGSVIAMINMPGYSHFAQTHISRSILICIGAMLFVLAPSANAHQPALSVSQPCTAKLGRFNPAKDLLLAHFDSKPDVDDLQSVAALGTMLKHPRFACVRYLAVAGTVGTQGGDFIPATRLFDLAFGKYWRDANADWSGAMRFELKRARAALENGGDIWIMEAGQSDFSAELIRKLAVGKNRIHVVQHSAWNEGATTPAALNFVRTNSDYNKIADGNAVGNGTPGFNIKDGSKWPLVLADQRVGAIWREAKRLSDLHNPKSAYVNPSVAAGGFDFSDAAEAAWIFGFEEMPDADAFFATFVGGHK